MDDSGSKHPEGKKNKDPLLRAGVLESAASIF
jgi:hypothetical protein